jgi:hypothetical protein
LHPLLSAVEESRVTDKEFDPSRYLTKVGKSDYLEVKWRLVWLRERHPDAEVSTELVSHSDQGAIFRARVAIPGGGSATGYGSETYADYRDYIEKAETKSLGRALAALGFGTQFSAHEFGGEAEAGRIVDAPVAHQNGPGATLPPRDRSTSTNTVTDEPTAYPSGVTNKQVKAIGAIASKLGLEPDEVKRMHGKDSATLLSRTEASALIERLSAMEAERGQQQAMAGVSGDPNRWGQ